LYNIIIIFVYLYIILVLRKMTAGLSMN